MSNGNRRVTASVSGGTYVLVGVGVAIASGGWSSLPMAFISGAFWPATLGYWLIRALQQYAGGG